MKYKDVIPIWFSKKKKSYYYSEGQKLICEDCKKTLLNNFILNSYLDNLSKIFIQFKFCYSCFEKTKNTLKGNFISVVIAEKEKTSVPVIPDTLVSKRSQSIKGKADGVCTMTDKEVFDQPDKLDTSKLKHYNPANSIEGAKIGDDNFLPSKDEEDEDISLMDHMHREAKVITVDEGLNFLDELGKAEPLIEEKEKELLE